MKKVFLSLLAIAAAGTMMAGVTPHFGLELGYDHGLAHVRTPADVYSGSMSYFFDKAQMDGFHFGGNMQLDFLDGQHKPGLILGVNYQFLAKNLMNADPDTKENIEEFKHMAKEAGASNISTYNYLFMHTIQIPVRFQYTYQINNDWRFFLNSGPQVRLHVAFTQDVNMTYKIDGKKQGVYSQADYVSGKTKTTTWIEGKKDIQTGNLEKSVFDCFDMSWGFGIGFGWKALSFNFGYDLGMINLYKKDRNGWRYNSDALAVTIGYRIK